MTLCGLNIIFTTTSSPTLRLTQPPIQWVMGAFSLGLGHEADHSSPSSAEVKNMSTYTSEQYLVKHRNNFT
jgi:hypothetical protein